MAHFTCRHRAGGSRSGLAAAAPRPAGRVRGGHLRHRLGGHPARAGRGPRGGPPGRPRPRAGRTPRAGPVPGLRVRARALVDRQGGDDAGPRTAGAAAHRGRRRVPPAARRSARGHRRRSCGRSDAAGGRGHGRHDLDDQRRPRACDCRRVRGRGTLAARGRRLRRRRRARPGHGLHPGRLRARGLVRRQPAQVALHTVRPERVLLAAHGHDSCRVRADARLPGDAGGRARPEPDGHGRAARPALPGAQTVGRTALLRGRRHPRAAGRAPAPGAPVRRVGGRQSRLRAPRTGAAQRGLLPGKAAGLAGVGERSRGWPHRAAQRRVLETVNASGEVFLSHTRIEGRFALRLAIGHIRTEQRHVERAWSLLQAAASDHGA